MRDKWIALLSTAFVLFAGTAMAATKVAGSACCPPCPFCR